MNSLILETVLASSALVMPCPAQHATLTVQAPAPNGVPVRSWPKREERREPPHLPDEENFLVLHVGSVSGNTNTSAQIVTYTSTDTELAWLQNAVGNKVIVPPVENVRVEWRYLTPRRTELSGHPHRKPLTARFAWLAPRARSRC